MYWFIARDVLESLGIIAAHSTLSRLDSSDKTAVGPDNPYGLHKHTVAISEQGLYELTLTSRKPAAQALKARLLGHISPTLRALPRHTQK
jgi:prophage antirepressor-like protein